MTPYLSLIILKSHTTIQTSVTHKLKPPNCLNLVVAMMRGNLCEGVLSDACVPRLQTLPRYLITSHRFARFEHFRATDRTNHMDRCLGT